jgi:AcrR family transcriptional regulator
MSPRTYNRSSRLAAAEETRRRIIRATVELHAEHGALGTTHEMIARRSDVSLPTVYKYFPTRNDLIPHCAGLVFSEAPVQVDASVFAGKADVPSRLHALCRRIFELHDYAAPWLRWSARDAGELPALGVLVEQTARERAALVRAALAPGFERVPPRRLVVASTVLVSFGSWQTFTGNGFTSPGAAAAVGETLVALFRAAQKENDDDRQSR